MADILEVVFENGVFRPLSTPSIPDGKRLRIRMEPTQRESPKDILELAGSVFDGLSDEEMDDVERIATDRRDFFEDRPK
jgi:predicted DNA-binding antitoxin AbrB/MazE fold protein